MLSAFSSSSTVKFNPTKTRHEQNKSFHKRRLYNYSDINFLKTKYLRVYALKYQAPEWLYKDSYVLKR
jgi:hypothetical protein